MMKNSSFFKYSRQISYKILALAFAISITTICYLNLVLLLPSSNDLPSQGREVLYLPRGQGLKFISFGYSNVFSQVLWFNTINYFGKHYRGDKEFRWLAKMCELVTDLNPFLVHSYSFCGSILAWEANMPQESIHILDKAINIFPDNWLFPYYRGFTSIYFLNDEEQGRNYLEKAAKLPGVHPTIVNLVAKKILSVESPESALEFLREALKSNNDPQMRKVFEDRIREIYYEKDLRTLEQQVKIYREQKNQIPKTLQELIPGFLSPQWAANKFQDPFGGNYYVDPNTAEVKSTSNHRRPIVKWNRASNKEATKAQAENTP